MLIFRYHGNGCYCVTKETLRVLPSRNGHEIAYLGCNMIGPFCCFHSNSNYGNMLGIDNHGGALLLV